MGISYQVGKKVNKLPKIGDFLSNFTRKEVIMASIYLNRKGGKIVSFKFKAFLGRDENGRHD